MPMLHFLPFISHSNAASSSQSRSCFSVHRAGPCQHESPFQPDLAHHQLCPDLLLGLLKLGSKADSSFVITNHFPSTCCPEMRSRYQACVWWNSFKSRRKDVLVTGKIRACSSNPTQQGFLLPYGWTGELDAPASTWFCWQPSPSLPQSPAQSFTSKAKV